MFIWKLKIGKWSQMWVGRRHGLKYQDKKELFAKSQSQKTLDKNVQIFGKKPFLRKAAVSVTLRFEESPTERKVVGSKLTLKVVRKVTFLFVSEFYPPFQEKLNHSFIISHVFPHKKSFIVLLIDQKDF